MNHFVLVRCNNTEHYHIAGFLFEKRKRDLIYTRRERNMKYTNLPIESVELDVDNPRIKQYISIYENVTSEELSLALSGSSASDAAGKYRALRDSIKENGGIFTPIIVNHITESDRYVVIEGNTRLKFYTEFKEQDPTGPWDEIPSIVYEDMPDDQIHAIRLQAHMVGARDWDAFSKAKYLDYLYNEEHKSMQFLKNFCGGQESYIRNLIEAYKDMTDSYIPYCDEVGMEPDTQVFSYYVELQKKSAKDALAIHGYSLKDFTKWVVNENLDRAESVRKIPVVLNDNIARQTFLKENMSAAVKKLDATDSETRKIAKSSLYTLAKEVTMKLRNISIREVDFLIQDPRYADKREIIEDLGYEVKFIMEKLGE